eukprot:gnl/TRDRNA2_/TRDRNA2_189893_c0_seq1.p1 gnl/TRDRNA2_/TRDRNA2_189893_c0~~gnl/TRDRNA2_/TRDRNA2_189893_c0_seq1.p1  ORF type:complete len:234 (+),score=41.42 gnl/TRDRNA2_/TRDRNA2_189893_c0_seq1:166-867(+)
MSGEDSAGAVLASQLENGQRPPTPAKPMKKGRPPPVQIFKKAPASVFLENPDGSLLYGAPPGAKEPTPPHTPREPWEYSLGVDSSMSAEFEQIYQKHEKLFTVMILMELVTEVTFTAFYVHYARYSINEVGHTYRHLSRSLITCMYWIMVVAEVTYLITYYVLASVAIWRSRPRIYRWFANAALVGLIAQVSLAYMNKFNLLVFFLRLMSYIYAKFLRNLLQSMMLLPRAEGQ